MDIKRARILAEEGDEAAAEVVRRHDLRHAPTMCPNLPEIGKRMLDHRFRLNLMEYSLEDHMWGGFAGARPGEPCMSLRFGWDTLVRLAATDSVGSISMGVLIDPEEVTEVIHASDLSFDPPSIDGTTIEDLNAEIDERLRALIGSIKKKVIFIMSHALTNKEAK